MEEDAGICTVLAAREIPIIEPVGKKEDLSW